MIRAWVGDLIIARVAKMTACEGLTLEGSMLCSELQSWYKSESTPALRTESVSTHLAQVCKPYDGGFLVILIHSNCPTVRYYVTLIFFVYLKLTCFISFLYADEIMY